MTQLPWPDSATLCQQIAAETGGKAVLSFSMGKDSIASYIQMRRHFSEIVPVYMYLIPGLSFIEEQLAYYEGVMGTHIYRMPLPALYRMWNASVYQAPDNLRVILESRLWEFDHDDVLDVVRAKLGWDRTVLSGTVVRAVDSPQRWSAMKTYGPINRKRGVFYPVYDWRKDQLIEEIRSSGIRLSADYGLFGRSFDGIDYRFLRHVADAYPDDYRRILECFPLAEMVLKRMEYRDAYFARKGQTHD